MPISTYFRSNIHQNGPEILGVKPRRFRLCTDYENHSHNPILLYSSEEDLDNGSNAQNLNNGSNAQNCIIYNMLKKNCPHCCTRYSECNKMKNDIFCSD
jgi:hypothetical protein